MLKRVLCGATAASLALAPIFADAGCFTDAEWRAAHVKALQLDLQVAALECANVQGASYTNEYNSFVTRFNDRLAIDAPQLEDAALTHVVDHSEIGEVCVAPAKKTTKAVAKKVKTAQK